MERWIHDFRYAARGLMRAPGFTLAAAATLALGIGGAAAVLALAGGILRPLPFPEAERLVTVQETRDGEVRSVAPANYLDWRGATTRFSGLAAHLTRGANLVVDGAAERGTVAEVSGNFFEVLGVPAALGSGFDPRLDPAFPDRVAVLSHALWAEAFASAPSAIGRTVRVDDQTYEVVGVAPPGFAFPDPTTRVWLRARTEAPEIGMPGFDPRAMRDAWYFQVVGRLADGSDLATATQEMHGVAERLARLHPDTNDGSSVRLTGLLDQTVGGFRSTLFALAGAVFLVLLTACVNVMHLALARGANRRRDTAVHVALGANRAALARRALTEGWILAALGAIGGLTLAAWTLRGVVASLGADLPRAHEIGIDAQTVGVTLALSVAVGVAIGAAGFLRAGSLRVDSGGLRARTSGGTWGTRALLSAQVAATVALLASAGLLGRSLLGLASVDLGFPTENVWFANVSLPDARSLSYPERTERYAAVLGAVARTPGVDVAGFGGSTPLSMGMEAGLVRPDAPDVGDPPSVGWHPVGPGFLEAIGVRIVSGRGLTPADGPDDPDVGLLNETAARVRFGAEDPIGRIVTIGLDGHTRPITIVGVVADTRTRGPAEAPGPVLYRPVAQTYRWGAASAVAAVRLEAGGDPAAALSALRSAARGLPVYGVRAGSDLAARFTRERTGVASLLGVFAAVSLLLGAVGIYGVTSFGVRAGRRDIGVRMALGADRPRVVTEVLGRGLAGALPGLVIGLALSAWAGSALSGLLYEVPVVDPVTWVAATALVTLVTTAALLFPARAAAATEPSTILRSE